MKTILQAVSKFEFDRVCFQKEKRAQISVGKWNKKEKKEKRKNRESTITTGRQRLQRRHDY